MVLTQLYQWKMAKSGLPRFPYHYGSHATVLLGVVTLRWVTSFHTTMVLTQPDPSMLVNGKVVPGFHTTMVLTQRG